MTQINRVMKYLYNGVGRPLAGAAEAVRIQARMKAWHSSHNWQP